MQALRARAMREMFLLTLLALLSRAPSSVGWSSDYEYVWSARDYGQGHCMEIPEDLRLCHGIGYTQMQLPNLLEHESMAEVKQQASSWLPLVNKNCHSGTRVFLCTFFAPVCLEKLIRPCRLFCEAVRDSCSPIMAVFGYPWPEMLNCSRLPLEDKELCINYNLTDTRKASDHMSACPPCDIQMNPENILEIMCASEFIIKTKIIEAKTENEDMVVTLHEKRKVVWDGALNNEELKQLVLYLRNGARCPCQQLENTNNDHLIMGRRVGARYLLTGIHQWDENNKEFKKLLKQIKNYKCPLFYSVFK